MMCLSPPREPRRRFFQGGDMVHRLLADTEQEIQGDAKGPY